MSLIIECTIPIASDDSIAGEEDMRKITDMERRILVCTQSFFAPYLLLLIDGSLNSFVPLGVGLCLVLTMWFATRRHLHKLELHLAFMGFSVSIVWIYLMANQIVLILQSLVYNLSHTIG